MPKTAPVGSAKTAIRPRSITSIGSAMTLPPASLTAVAVASASSTETYEDQAGGWPSCISGIIPATSAPLFVARR